MQKNITFTVCYFLLLVVIVFLFSYKNISKVIHYLSDEEYFKQLTSEKQMIQNTKTGGIKIAWVKDPSVRNEALDTYVYARATAHIMGLDNPSKNWRPFENKLKVEEVNPKQNPTKKSAESTAEILKRYQKNQSLV